MTIAKDVYESSARLVLEDIAYKYSFDTFVHFADLARLSQARDIPSSEWARLLDAWKEQYFPGHFLTENRRGNCVDFAVYAQEALGSVGLKTAIIGKLPDDDFTPDQRAFMVYRHTSLIASDEYGKPQYMFEPGWRAPVPIPLEIRPIGELAICGDWSFGTRELTDDELVQATISPLGKPGQRIFSLQELSTDRAAILTGDLLRIPRRMEMINALRPDEPTRLISFNLSTGELSTNIRDIGLPTTFTPSDITQEQNNVLSAIFDCNVKEELTIALDFRSSLPADFWIQ